MHILENKPCVECGLEANMYLHFKFGTFFICGTCLQELLATIKETLKQK